MAETGRLQPFGAVTQSIAFAMPAKGKLRPETVIGRGLMRNVRLWIRKRTFEPIAAAQNDLRGGYVGFGITERK